MSLSRAASALGVAVALGEVESRGPDGRGDRPRLVAVFSRASTSAGVELADHEIVVLGAAPGWSGPLRIGHCVMRDAIDIEPVRAVLAELGSPRAGQLAAAAARRASSRCSPRRRRARPGRCAAIATRCSNDSDISSTRHARAFVAGALAGLVGHAEIFVSGGAEHQGPDGGGPVAIIATRARSQETPRHDRRPAARQARRRPRAARRSKPIGMTKTFGRFTALDDVSINVPAGTFHALLGENGAGKSTLVKCVMGFYIARQGHADAQRDRKSRCKNPRDAQALGVGMVYQHFTLVPSLTAAENLVASRADAPAVINWRKERERLESVPRQDAVPRAARPAGLLARGGREAEARNPQAALSRPALPHPRRADLGADARRGRRNPRAAARTWRIAARSPR